MDNFLLENTPEVQKMRENLLDLIETYDVSNINLAFSIMEGGNVPKELYTHLLSLYIWHENKDIHRTSFKLIRRFLPQSISLKVFLFNALHTRYHYDTWHVMRYEGTENSVAGYLEKISATFREDEINMSLFAINTIKMIGIGTKYCLHSKNVSLKEVFTFMSGRMNAINLSGFDLTILPDEICDIEDVKYLNISRNKFKKLPENFEKLTSLEAVAFQNTPLLPTEIVRLEAMLPLYFAEEYYNKGCNLKHQKKKPAKAVPIFEKSVALNPAYPEAWHNLAACFLDTNQYEKAQMPLQKALNGYNQRLDNQIEEAYNFYWKSCVYALMKDKENAFKYLKFAIANNPQYRYDVQKEEDYCAYHNDPEFGEIVAIRPKKI